MGHILIAEDDHAIRELIEMNFTVAGHTCTGAADGAQALALLKAQTFDLALLDIMLPELDGFELIPYMKEAGLPVIFVSAKNATADKVRGLTLDAEDYIVKPFDTLELLVRAEKVLLRHKKDVPLTLTVAGILFDAACHVALKGGQAVDLSPIEFRLALLFARHPGIAFSREQLLREAWGDDFFGETRTVDVHIASQRKKLDWQDDLITVYRIGYRLKVSL